MRGDCHVIALNFILIENGKIIRIKIDATQVQNSHTSLSTLKVSELLSCYSITIFQSFAKAS